MKTTRLILMLLPMLLTACPEKSGGSASSTLPSLKVAVCQPDKPEAIPALISTLTTTLKEQVWAKQRALELQIVLADGTTQSVPAPAEKGWMEKFFGPNTPAVREQKLTAQLAALESRFKSGCNNASMSLSTLKAVPESLYAGEAFVAWTAHGGGKNPWAQEKQKPVAFVADASALDTALRDQQAQNLLVLTSSVTLPVAKAKPVKKPVSKVAQKTKAGPAQVAATDKDAPPPPTPPLATSPGSTLVFNLAEKGRDTDAALPVSSQPVGVPEGSEYFASIPHDVGSARIDKDGLALQAREIKRLQSQFDFVVVLICRADRLKGSTPDRNHQLSELRAHVCEAALIELGVPVHKTICIGDALAEGVSDLERGTAIYLVNKTAKPGAEISKTASR